MNSLRAASAAYLNDDKFSDFIIVCGEKEYNVHRCFIAAHSKWVGRCCSGTFAEGIHRKVELKEDIPLAVERMIEYFYKLDYDETPSDNGTGYAEAWSHHPIFPMQLSAHMYAIADKYEVAELKDLALKKFKSSSLSVITDKAHLMGAAYAIYEWIEMPDSDRALKDILIDMWIVGSLELKATAHELLNLPKFAADLSARLLEGFS